MDPIIKRCSPPAPEIRSGDQSWGAVGDPPCPDGRPQRPCELLGFRLKAADLLQLRVVLRDSDGGVCHAAIDERPDRDKTKVASALRPIYTAANADAALAQLHAFEDERAGATPPRCRPGARPRRTSSRSWRCPTSCAKLSHPAQGLLPRRRRIPTTGAFGSHVPPGVPAAAPSIQGAAMIEEHQRHRHGRSLRRKPATRRELCSSPSASVSCCGPLANSERRAGLRRPRSPWARSRAWPSCLRALAGAHDDGAGWTETVVPSRGCDQDRHGEPGTRRPMRTARSDPWSIQFPDVWGFQLEVLGDLVDRQGTRHPSSRPRQMSLIRPTGADALTSTGRAPAQRGGSLASRLIRPLWGGPPASGRLRWTSIFQRRMAGHVGRIWSSRPASRCGGDASPPSRRRARSEGADRLEPLP